METYLRNQALVIVSWTLILGGCGHGSAVKSPDGAEMLDIVSANYFHLYLHEYCRRLDCQLKYLGPLSKGKVVGISALHPSSRSLQSWQITGPSVPDDKHGTDWFALTVSTRSRALKYRCRIGGREIFVDVDSSESGVGGSKKILPTMSCDEFVNGFVSFVGRFQAWEENSRNCCASEDEMIKVSTEFGELSKGLN